MEIFVYSNSLWQISLKHCQLVVWEDGICSQTDVHFHFFISHEESWLEKHISNYGNFNHDAMEVARMSYE